MNKREDCISKVSLTGFYEALKAVSVFTWLHHCSLTEVNKAVNLLGYYRIRCFEISKLMSHFYQLIAKNIARQNSFKHFLTILTILSQ